MSTPRNLVLYNSLLLFYGGQQQWRLGKWFRKRDVFGFGDIARFAIIFRGQVYLILANRKYPLPNHSYIVLVARYCGVGPSL